MNNLIKIVSEVFGRIEFFIKGPSLNAQKLLNTEIGRQNAEIERLTRQVAACSVFSRARGVEIERLINAIKAAERITDSGGPDDVLLAYTKQVLLVALQTRVPEKHG